MVVVGAAVVSEVVGLKEITMLEVVGAAEVVGATYDEVVGLKLMTMLLVVSGEAEVDGLADGCP